MKDQKSLQKLVGVVERITYHNPQNGWTVLKVAPFREPNRLVAVVVHQAKVFAGATMEFWGEYSQHSKHGEQFKASQAIERKPASAAALEKYLGSGLIKGVGPAIAKRIVKHFGEETLQVFERQMPRLLAVPGIAEKKLASIASSWDEHRSIRDVMIFLQGHGISTLFATKIFQTYGNQAIEKVSKNPYQLAKDIYGIGFFSADRIALAMGFDRRGLPRMEAGLQHLLASSREEGHCYLELTQLQEELPKLLNEELPATEITRVVEDLLARQEIYSRPLSRRRGTCIALYSRSLFFDELGVAKAVQHLLLQKITIDQARVQDWLSRYAEKSALQLSSQQSQAVLGVLHHSLSILTGGPGCGKTTTTKTLVHLLLAMKKTVLLAAPTGRAAQRMTEVIGVEAKTIHRLLEWTPTSRGFQRNADNPLECDFLLVDEVSMLDVSLAASLLKALPRGSQILLIGDPDQLPSVGAGNVLGDLLRSPMVPRFQLTQVFRQAQESSIVRFAHEMNQGRIPRIRSLLQEPLAFRTEKVDCLFVDSEEATQEQLNFLQRARLAIANTRAHGEVLLAVKRKSVPPLHPQSGQALTTITAIDEDCGSSNDLPEALAQESRSSNPEWTGKLSLKDGEVQHESWEELEKLSVEKVRTPYLSIPEKFQHVNLAELAKSPGLAEELAQVVKKVPPYSTLHYGLTASASLVRLYTKTVPELLGKDVEIQVLTPQIRGSLGTLAINQALQSAANPPGDSKAEVRFGDRIFRTGDRVIQTRNNYQLGVTNGDIGTLVEVDPVELTCTVKFGGLDSRIVEFSKEELQDLQLAYAITVHKSQGSEFSAVILPILGQHHNMLFRNLLYTGLTRAKKLAIFLGTRRALALAVQQTDSRERQTALTDLIQAL